MRRLYGSSVIYALANIVNAGIPFLLLPVFTRVLTPEDYGAATMFATFLSVLGTVTGLNTNAALSVRFFQQDRFSISVYVSTCLFILLVSAGLVLSLVLLSVSWLQHFIHVPAKWLVIAVIVSAAQFVVQIPLFIWRASNEAVKYCALQVIQGALNGGLSLWFIIGLGWQWEGRAGGQSISILILGVFALALLRVSGLFKSTPKKRYVVDALKFGVPLIPHSIGAMLMSMCDRVMITNLLDISQTGIYMVAMQVGMVVGLLTDSFNKSFGPWLFGALGSVNEAGKMRIVGYTYLYFGAVTVIASAIGMLSPWLFSFIVGERFRAASSIAIYIALGYALNGMYLMVTNYIFFSGKTHFLAMITLFSGVLSIVIGYVLINQLGLRGAGLGFVVSQGVFFSMAWFLAHKVFPMPWKRAVVVCIRKFQVQLRGICRKEP